MNFYLLYLNIIKNNKMELEDELTDVEMIDENNNVLPKSPNFIIDDNLIFYDGKKYKKYVFCIYSYSDFTIKIIDNKEYLYYDNYLYIKL